MPFPRPRFRLSTLLWITLAVACFFGGMRVERWRAECEREDLDLMLFGRNGYPLRLGPLPPQGIQPHSDR
jgi:hypothetical protein